MSRFSERVTYLVVLVLSLNLLSTFTLISTTKSSYGNDNPSPYHCKLINSLLPEFLANYGTWNLWKLALRVY